MSEEKENTVFIRLPESMMKKIKNVYPDLSNESNSAVVRIAINRLLNDLVGEEVKK